MLQTLDINHNLIPDKSIFVIDLRFDNLFKINKISDSITGNNDNQYLSKEISWSSNNYRYTPYIDFKNLDINKISISSELYFKIRYTKNGSDDTAITINSVTFDIEEFEGCGCIDTETSTGVDIVNQTPFNPYELLQGFNLQNQLNTVINQMQGVEVLYFKTSPDKDTTDVFLNEYSMRGVVDHNCIKVVVPDGRMPEPKPQYTEWGIDIDVFIINIDRNHFKSVFGKNSEVREEDFILFKFANKMFYINSFYLDRGLNNELTYYICSLKKYDNDVSMLKPKSVKDFIDNITLDKENIFGDKIAIEMEDSISTQDRFLTTNKNEIRSYINRNITIPNFVLLNNGTNITKFYYDLSSIDKGLVAVKYLAEISNSIKNSAYSALLSFTDDGFVNDPFSIISIQEIDKFNHICTIDRTIENLQIFSFIKSENGEYFRITKIIDKSNFVITDYNKQIETDILYFTTSLNTLLKIGETENQFRYDLVDNRVLFIVSGKIVSKIVLQNELLKERWYGIVINHDSDNDQISCFVYEPQDHVGYPAKYSTKLKLVSKSFLTNELNKNIDFLDKSTASIISSNMLLTNIRIWNTTIQEDNNSIILNSEFVRNSSKTLVIDNAINPLNIPQIGKTL